MLNYDLSPFYRSTIGFDRLLSLLDKTSGVDNAQSYPPYNIERTGENAYRITLAVAGFKPAEIDITAQQNLLVVAGRKGEEAPAEGTQFLHIGIANRGFERRFELADFVRVEAANLEDGLLVIDLVREVPEAMKPRKISIGAPALTVVEGGAATAAA